MRRRLLRPEGDASVNDMCAYFGVKIQTILVWRKSKGMPWRYNKRPDEFGSRNEVVFDWRKVRMWARVNHIKVARVRLEKQRSMGQ